MISKSIFKKIFNVKSGEMPLVSIAWALNFLYRMMFIFAWTSAVVVFVSKYGVSYLPYLFIVNAIFIICGTFLYSVILSRFSSFYVMVFSSFFLSILYFFSFYFVNLNFLLFFFSLMIAVSVVSQQLKIGLVGYIEDMFSSLQGERLFPLIESADTFGGVTAGVLSIVLSSAYGVNIFLFICVVISILLVLFLLFSSRFVSGFNKINCSSDDVGIFPFIRFLPKYLGSTVYLRYVSFMFVSVFLYWGMFNVLEFLYTNAIYYNISDVVMDGGSGFQHALIHDLGGLFILYSLSSFLVQLLAGSRLIKSLGVFGSMILHPLLMFFNVLGLVFNYGFASAVLAKNNSTITSVVYTNSYHVSFYVLSEKYRFYIRGISDGIVRPLGALFGTFLIIILQYFFTGKTLLLNLNFSLFVLSFFLFYILYKQRANYTDLAIADLADDRDLEVRINAVDVLAQRGHFGHYPVLQHILMNIDSPLSLRLKILEAFSELGAYEVIYDIISCLSDKKFSIRRAALIALSSYDFGHKKFKEHMIDECRLISVLKLRFSEEPMPGLRGVILNLLMIIDRFSTFQFLIAELSRGLDGEMLSEVIFALSNYDDSSILSLIEHYTSSSDDLVRRSALLCKARLSNVFALGFISDAFGSGDKAVISDALFLIGELGLKKFKKKCYEYLHSTCDECRMLAAVAFAKMGNFISVYVLSHFLVHSDIDFAIRTKFLIENLEFSLRKKINNSVSELILSEFSSLNFDGNSLEVFSNFDTDTQLRLRWMFELMEKYDMIDRIDILLKNK